MTRLQNLTLGIFVAIILMGPAAWSGARHAVMQTQSLVVAVITGAPVSDAVSLGDSTVRSVILRK